METGVAGLSIEDFTGDENTPLYDIDVAAGARPSRARRRSTSPARVVLTGRADGFLHGGRTSTTRSGG